MVKTKQELINLLIQKNGLARKTNLNFINVLVNLINDTLRDERQLKITGLGTFKVIDTKDRESVNVNTGDRFVIEGRNKITFTPDNAMKELVNRPFSQFETVVLNDGVDFSDLPSLEGETTLSTDVQEPVVEKTDEVLSPVFSAPLMEVVDEIPTEENAPAVEEPLVIEELPAVEEVPVVKEEPASEETPIVEESSSVEETPAVVAIAADDDTPVIEEPSTTAEEMLEDDLKNADGEQSDVTQEENGESPFNTESTDNDDNNIETSEEQIMEENNSNFWKWLVALIVFTAAGFAGGYYVGKKYAPARYIPIEKTEMIQGELVDSAMVDSLYESDSIQKAKDAKIKAKVDSITRAHEARNESIRVAKLNKVNEKTAKIDAAIAAKQAVQQTGKTGESATPAVALPKGDNSQTVNNAKMMMSKGAYNIVGTQEVITVKAGQNMKKISKFYLGDGMECYIQAYNGVAEVSEGMRLKIPKLQVKKKK